MKPSYEELESAAQCPQRLAFLRIDRLLGVTTTEGGLAADLCEELQKEIDSYLVSSSSTQDGGGSLKRLLQLCLALTQQDAIFQEEFARQGAHGQLLRLLKHQPTKNNHDNLLEELQELASEIGASDASFPQKQSPFTLEELRRRLPLVFPIQDNTNVGVLVHQVTGRQSAQQDVGYVVWPSALVLAHYLARNPSLVVGNHQHHQRILELGAGCGLLGLTVATLRKQLLAVDSSCSAPPVLLTDYNKTVLHNLKQNIRLNNLDSHARVVGLDFYQQSGTSQQGWIDLDGHVQDPVDLVVAADIVCQPEDAYRAANAFHDTLCPGGRAIYMGVDATHRFGVEQFRQACQNLGLHVQAQTIRVGPHQDNDDATNTTTTDNWWLDDKGLLLQLEQTSGYIQGYQLTMFSIVKPN